MNKLSLLFFLFFLSALMYSCQTPSTRQDQTDFISLFNGENLDGWFAQGKLETSVSDGILNLSNDQSGEGGWLLSNDTYADFFLQFDFLCPPPNNSGVTIRYNNEKEGDPATSGYEVNLFNTPDTPNPTGSINNVARSFIPDSLKILDWNHMEIIARGDCLVTRVNGTDLLVTHQRRILNGHIGFQAFAGKDKHTVQLRNIRLKKFLPAGITGPTIEDYMRSTTKVTAESLFDNGDLGEWEIVGDGTWKVNGDQILGKSGKEDFSFLRSVNAYGNFYLSLKFKIEKDQNSGVFIRQDPESQEIGLETGMEINIYDHDGFAYGWPTGSNVTRARAFIGLVDYSDWNTMEIFAFDQHICVYVNGIKASEYYADAKFSRPGNICLQVGKQVATEERGDSEVAFREITIRDFSEIPFIGF